MEFSVFNFNTIQADIQKLREIDNVIDCTIIINDKTYYDYIYSGRSGSK